MDNIFTIETSEQKIASPLVLDSPHSGRAYPDDFGHNATDHELKKAEDRFVDKLFEKAAHSGIPLLKAEFPRTYIDVNRPPDDIDEMLLEQNWPEDIHPSRRAKTGIGLVRRILNDGSQLYDRKLSVQEIKNRIDHYYHPYHNALETLLQSAYDSFGQVWHLNCHSMPSNSAPSVIRKVALPKKVDFVLGDRDGTSCDITFRLAAKEFLESLGYSVLVNSPYKGVEILRRYGRPHEGFHSMQIEINKSLYMNEALQEKNAYFETLQDHLTQLTQYLAAWCYDQTMPMAAD